jgi:hypothetical protein
MARDCPKCNGHQVNDTAAVVSPLTGKPKRKYMLLGIVWGLVLFFGGGWIITGIVSGAGINMNRPSASVTAIVVSLAAVLIISPLVVLWGIIQAVRNRGEVTHHAYYCQLCGFTWSWRESQDYPYPAGTRLASNADELRRLGEARLAQQTQQTIQNAGYFLIQQRDHGSN